MSFLKSTSETSILESYLQDESRKTGTSTRIFFPENESDVCAVFRKNPHTPVTLQGARTGLTAGCVPEGGLTVNLERMNQILDFQPSENGGSITVQPGILLQTLRQYLQRHPHPRPLFFPPDPTESTASLGGMISCNSSGARSFRYGAVRDYVLALDLILPDGDKLHLERGNNHASGLQFQLETCGGRLISGALPALPMPKVKKHTAGYFIKPNMDLIDLFIGAEGTLGVITSARLRLLPRKKLRWGAVLFLPKEDCALSLVKTLRNKTDDSAFPLEALEFFGSDTLNLLRHDQRRGLVLRESEFIREDADCAVYVEFTADDRALLMDAFSTVCRELSAAGGDPARTWAAINASHIEKLREFRHAAPECVNRKIREIKKSVPQITKLGTDMSVPDSRLEDVFSLYREGIQAGGFESAVFGHIGNNHVHVNLIPHDMAQYSRGKTLFETWAKAIVQMGGTVSAEHGVGKLKAGLLKTLYSEEQLRAMKQVKQCLDPEMLLNQGNIFGK